MHNKVFFLQICYTTALSSFIVRMKWIHKKRTKREQLVPLLLPPFFDVLLWHILTTRSLKHSVLYCIRISHVFLFFKRLLHHEHSSSASSRSAASRRARTFVISISISSMAFVQEATVSACGACAILNHVLNRSKRCYLC